MAQMQVFLFSPKMPCVLVTQKSQIATKNEHYDVWMIEHSAQQPG